MSKKIYIFDSTLRDGAQGESISFSVLDKLNIVKALDNIGVDFIEAGNPGSNPKDLEFFEKVKDIHLKTAKLVAFGSTRRRGIHVEEDSNIQSILSAETEYVAIFGKTWDFHVTDIIHTTLEENLLMIEETIRFLVSKNKKVIFDAEHFFDGYKSNKEYAIKALLAAKKGGAYSLDLCDTNGGTLPDELVEITKAVIAEVDMQVGVHCHNDSGVAVANSILGVKAGITQVQGTFIGFGERCGNAHLATIIGNLQIKEGYTCIPKEKLERLTDTARLIAEIANISIDENTSYVGKNAFSHKGGMHIDGVNKNSKSFEHISPSVVGNTRRFLMSEVSGRSTILKKIQRIAPNIKKDSEETARIMSRLKELEHEGYQFEGAESTFELIIRKNLGKYKPFFELENFKIINEKPTLDSPLSAYAMVKVNVEGNKKISAAEGDGPVNALDKALREALEVFYPELKNVQLVDYKVRVLGSQDATAAKVRVLITSTDNENHWTTVGVSTDIVEASLIALVDSIEVKLIKEIEKKMQAYI